MIQIQSQERKFLKKFAEEGLKRKKLLEQYPKESLMRMMEQDIEQYRLEKQKKQIPIHIKALEYVKANVYMPFSVYEFCVIEEYFAEYHDFCYGKYGAGDMKNHVYKKLSNAQILIPQDKVEAICDALYCYCYDTGVLLPIDMKLCFDTWYDWNTYNDTGIVYGKLDEHNRGIQRFRKALNNNPNLAEAYRNMGFAYDRALECYEKAMALTSKRTDTFYNIGSAYMEIGESINAFYYFKLAWQLEPDNADICNRIGNAYACLESWRNFAIYWFKKAIDSDSECVAAYANLGQIHEDIEDIEKARYYYQKAADLGSEDAQKWLKENQYRQFIPLTAKTETRREIYLLKFNVLEDGKAKFVQ
jgi:tetratricopeptide (TPR) repeat protein